MATSFPKVLGFGRSTTRTTTSIRVAASAKSKTNGRQQQQRHYNYNYYSVAALPQWAGSVTKNNAMMFSHHHQTASSCTIISPQPQRFYYSSTPSPQSSAKSFKKVIRPFLIACHPDAMAMGTTTSDEQQQDQQTAPTKNKRSSLSQQAKTVNLKAVQTINGLVDTLDDLIERCTPPSASALLRGGSNRKSSVTGAGSLPELKSTYEIEFILPTDINEHSESSSHNHNHKLLKRKHRDKVALSLRSITLSFPEELRGNVREWALTIFPSSSSSDNNNSSQQQPMLTPREEEAYSVAMQLKEHSIQEFLRLLSIAGMQALPGTAFDTTAEGRLHRQHQELQSHGGYDNMGEEQLKDENSWTLSDHFLHELGIDPMEDVDPAPQSQGSESQSAFFGRTQSSPLHRSSSSGPGAQGKKKKAAPPTYSHIADQREQFVKSIQWNKFADDYDNAFKDAQADLMTSNLNLYNINTVEGRERREKFVSDICGSVRIWLAKLDDSSTSDDDDDDNGDVVDDIIPEGLDVVAQLIAIRRLSLLLYDNFDYLEMEKTGRMWEQLVVVLVPPRKDRMSARRNVRDDGTLIVHPGRKLSKFERRLRRRDNLKGVSRDKMRYYADKYLGPPKEEEGHALGGEASSGKDESSDEQNRIPYLTESGFKFSYGTSTDQGMGHVTAYIPIDFRDGELVRQMYTHLRSYFDTVGSAGFLEYGADGELRAAAGGEYTSRSDSQSRRSKKMGAEE